jgi:hypothetical protein
MLDELFQDFRISVRGLLRTPPEIRPNSRRMDVSPANWPDWQLLLRPLPYPHAELYFNTLFTLACASFDSFDKLTPFNIATSRTSLW